MEEPYENNGKAELKQEALMRLLCHYLIFIGKATSLLEVSSDEATLVKKWRSQWNKPAAFTWNSSSGLEMHYRIQPPADWIVSSFEDDLMSSIDLDLSEQDGGDEFTLNADLVRCLSCDTFWAILDDNGYCRNCQSLDMSYIFQDSALPSTANTSFGSSGILESGTSLESSLLEAWDYLSSNVTLIPGYHTGAPVDPLQRHQILDSLHAEYSGPPIECVLPDIDMTLSTNELNILDQNFPGTGIDRFRLPRDLNLQGLDLEHMDQAPIV